jgi:arginyl-tRNA synthetase
MATAANPIDQLAQRVEGLTLQNVTADFPTTHADVNPYDFWRAHLTKVLNGITGVDPKIIYPTINWTSGLDKGDFVVAVAAFRLKGTKPDVLAQEWAEKFPADDPLFEKPKPVGPQLAFFVKSEPLIKTLVPQIRAVGDSFGHNTYDGLKDAKDPSQGQKKILVEYSSPNVAKNFHAGHLRSTIIGGFLAKLYEAAGWNVYRINYLGDWGKQYGLLALAFELYGNEEELQKDPIDHLFQLYVRINREKEDEAEEIEAFKKEGKDTTELEAKSKDELARQYFKRMVEGDEAVLSRWRHFKDVSIQKYKKTYARLNVFFDSYSGESGVSEEAMANTAKMLEEKKISKEDNGSVIVDFEGLVPGKEGKRLGKTVIRKRDGTALYLTRDISELLNRDEHHKYDKLLYVVASQQELHLRQLFKIVDLLGRKDIVQKTQHISFGMVLGMSTRKGTVKFLDDILNDCAEHMHNVMRKNEDKYAQVANPEATADTLGISAVMVQDMRGKIINNYNFDMEAMTSFEGDTGPYLQYAHARLCSIKRRADLSDEAIASADLTLLTESHAINVVRMLVQWPDVFQNTLKTLEPTTVLTYLFRLTHVISSSYDVLQVVGSEEEIKKARMALYDAARIVLANGMKLLGLSPLQRM